MPIVEEPVRLTVSGRALLENPLLNKGSAFTERERRELGLLGLLPAHISTMEEQLARVYENYKRNDTEIERYIFLAALQDRNETLFYRLVQAHIDEMIPVIYTPGVGAGCEQYSHIYRRPRGLYISYPLQHEMDRLLANSPTPQPDVIVVTDGERILGLGDLGVGGMGIPVGKLALYTVCAGINPATTLPIVLDVGTNNRLLLEDPLYLGWRHERIAGAEYDAFVERFVAGVLARFPRALLQWEDFSKHNAARLLDRYRDRLCTFNDDIQGTGAVTLAGLLTATAVTGERLRDQRVAILGAGSSAIGISDQIAAAMIATGAPPEDARKAIWLIDSQGLVETSRPRLEEAKQAYAQSAHAVAGWRLKASDRIELADVVRNAHPTVLIGVSAQPGAFTEAIVRDMSAHAARPIVFPLSNPTSKSEAIPADVMAWTDGRALVASGSPFPGIGQCNNAFIFPGVGLGVIASGATRVTNAMFVAAARELSKWAPARREPHGMLYPPLSAVRDVARDVATAVAMEAVSERNAEPMTTEELQAHIDCRVWNPVYASYTRA